MSSIVYQRDKRVGITYAYESISYWDKEKQQPRSKRKLIGRLNEETGEIEPTDERRRKKMATEQESIKAKQGPVPSECVRRSFYGATYLLDAIGKKLGITKDLKTCFPKTYKQLLSIAYFLILEEHNPLYRFEKWATLHKHPYDKTITSQRSSELFASITEENKHAFFRLQVKRKTDNEHWAYDITSISSYSECLKQVQYGHNKEDDRLPQFNLALVFGETSSLPFYYRKLSGNIPDSKTVKHLLADLGTLGFQKVSLVMDRGFYSKDNVNALYKDHVKFLMAGKMSLKFMRSNLESIYEDFKCFENYDDAYNLYYRTVQTQWEYTQIRHYKRDVLKESRRIYLHYYYNIIKAAEDEQSFDRRLMKLKRELESGNPISKKDKQYEKYFEVTTTPKLGTKAIVRKEVISEAKKYFGFFTLVSNKTMDGITALETYRNKDLVEKAFGNLKERLNMRRAMVSSEESLDGKLFVEFIALIYLSYIKKQMQLAGLFKNYTLQGILDKLDVIECFEAPRQKLRVGELLEKQRDIYKALGVEPPT